MVKRIELDLWAESPLKKYFVDPPSSCICGLHWYFPRDTRNTPYLDALRTTYLFVDPVLSPSVRKKKVLCGHTDNPLLAKILETRLWGVKT